MQRCRHSPKLTLGVGLDSRGRDTLGQRVDAPLDEPAEEDGGSLDVVLFGDRGDRLVLTQGLSVGSSEGRVSLGENVVLLEPLDELGLGALDGELDLVWKGSATHKAVVCADLPATGLILHSFKSFWTRLMLKLETPIDLTNPWSTS
jgi:hypothetical protein